MALVVGVSAVGGRPVAAGEEEERPTVSPKKHAAARFIPCHCKRPTNDPHQPYKDYLDVSRLVCLPAPVPEEGDRYFYFSCNDLRSMNPKAKLVQLDFGY